MNVTTQLKNSAGSWILAGGVFLTLAQLLFWTTIDSTTIVSTVQSPTNNFYNILDVLGYFSLLIGVCGWALQDGFSGKFAMLRFLLPFLGTLFVFGDVWFETFAVPSSVEMAPTLASAAPGKTLMLGIVLSFVLFTLGWLVTAIHAIVKRYLPIWSGVLLAIAALYGFQATIFPHILPFALVMILIGWQLRTSAAQKQASGLSV